MPLLDCDGKLIRQSLLMPLKMTGHRKWIRFFKLRRQGFCESHFDELFKRSFAFVDPRANQSAFPAIQNERGKCPSRKVLWRSAPLPAPRQ